jgi:predicted ATP-binding protein involved in virulence
MLHSLEAEGVNGRGNLDIRFNKDINIITGKNGSGKTTVLKLIWYLISANIERIPQEMTFKRIKLEGDNFLIEIKGSGRNYEMRSTVYDKNVKFQCTLSDIKNESPQVRELNQNLGMVGASIFFPTFRRIEGGFSLGDTRQQNELEIRRGRYAGDLNDALEHLSARMSMFDHKFVCSISTSDVVNLLARRYADISQTTNKAHTDLVKFIVDVVEKQTNPVKSGSKSAQKKNSADLLSNANKVFEQIKLQTLEFKQQQEFVLTPFQALSETMSKVIQDKGIKVNDNIILGNEFNRISSEFLSAGEKQIFSFLAYNAFYDEIPIFIDEPELSLHVDWQRSLIPMLLEQKTNNQFFIAIHSPFIYSKYEDKEIFLGGVEGE